MVSAASRAFRQKSTSLTAEPFQEKPFDFALPNEDQEDDHSLQSVRQIGEVPEVHRVVAEEPGYYFHRPVDAHHDEQLQIQIEPAQQTHDKVTIAYAYYIHIFSESEAKQFQSKQPLANRFRLARVLHVVSARARCEGNGFTCTRFYTVQTGRNLSVGPYAGRIAINGYMYLLL